MRPRVTKPREWASERLNRLDRWARSAKTQWGETGRFALIGLVPALITAGLTEIAIQVVVR